MRSLRELIPSHVIYVNSLSKIVGGGLRMGWVAARGAVRDRIALLKLEADFHSPTLIQHIAARWLASGAYDRHVDGTLPFYRERRDALLAALERHLPGEYRVNVPRGGHHLWVTLTRPIDERALYAEAVRTGVTFTPGGAISVERRSQTSRAAVLLAARPAGARRGRAPARAGDPRGAPPRAPLGRGAAVLAIRGALSPRRRARRGSRARRARAARRA